MIHFHRQPFQQGLHPPQTGRVLQDHRCCKTGPRPLPLCLRHHSQQLDTQNILPQRDRTLRDTFLEQQMTCGGSLSSSRKAINFGMAPWSVRNFEYVLDDCMTARPEEASPPSQLPPHWRIGRTSQKHHCHPPMFISSVAIGLPRPQEGLAGDVLDNITLTCLLCPWPQKTPLNLPAVLPFCGSICSLRLRLNLPHISFLHNLATLPCPHVRPVLTSSCHRVTVLHVSGLST